MPEQTLLASTLGRPATTFAAIDNAMNWKDWTPRLGASYDLRGDGKTAVKVEPQQVRRRARAVGSLTGSANPIGRLTNSASRNWTDVNGDKIVNCDLTQRRRQNLDEWSIDHAGPPTRPSEHRHSGRDGEQSPTGCPTGTCGEGWGVRSYNWEFSAGVQREIMPRVSVDVSYFRRWFGNFTATDNTARLACPCRLPVVQHRDPDATRGCRAAAARRSPASPTSRRRRRRSGDGRSTGPCSPTTSARTRSALERRGRQRQRAAPERAAAPGRHQHGPAATPTTAGSRRCCRRRWGTTRQSFCEQTEPFRTQFKWCAAYTLPRYAALPSTMATVLQNIQMAGTFQSIPGIEMNATYAMPNSEFRNAALSNSTGPPGSRGSVNGGERGLV